MCTDRGPVNGDCTEQITCHEVISKHAQMGIDGEFMRSVQLLAVKARSPTTKEQKTNWNFDAL